MKSVMTHSKLATSISKAVIGLMIVNSASLSFADMSDTYRAYGVDKDPTATDNSNTQDSGPGLFATLKHWIEGDSTPAVPTIKIVQGLHRDDNCLSLQENEVFYPLHETPDANILPKTYIDPNLPNMTINLSAISALTLKRSRGANIDIQDWPIVFRGPLKFCGSVDIQFESSDPAFIKRENRRDRVEIGPRVVIQGDRNVSVVSSQIRNLEITGACVGGDANTFNSQTPCIRLENDSRTTLNYNLFIKHEGAKICRLDNLNITDAENNSPGFSRKNPLPCDRVPDIAAPVQSEEILASIQTSTVNPTLTSQNTQHQSQSPTQSSSPVISVPAQRNNCDGPYVALINPSFVDVNYGVQTVAANPAPQQVKAKAKPPHKAKAKAATPVTPAPTTPATAKT